jgi:toxin ParE1/3/4
MVRINWTKIAIDDLKSIYEFILRDSKRYARIQVKRLKIRVRILKTNPYAGRVVPEIDDARYRELIGGNYRIIYRISDDKSIDILTVYHSARDIEKRHF